MLPEEPIRTTVFEIFAARAGAELRRLRAERELRAREAQLARLVESTMDAIVQLDGELRVRQMNAAAERSFELPSEHAQAVPLSRLVSADDAAKLSALGAELLGRPAHERSTWVPGGLTGLAAGGSSFPAEATFSAFELDGRQHFTLILRSVKDRLEAERRIVSLTDEAEYLRTELRELGRSGDLAALERDNLLRALESTGWQIAGDSGAARLLGMAPSTLASRIKALGLRHEG